ncbi:Methyltransferase domain-containing protein [Frankineae bacterium MT45]|nr:Methyltransferase domain-containing protein [Frankineae bacterium MT45]
MESARIRHRQGPVHVIDGVPYPDRASTLSVLPGSVVGQWLADNAGAVRGDLLDLGAGNQPFRPWYEPLAKSVVALDVAPAPGLSLLSMAAPLPFQASSFDTILCTSVLEHVDNAEKAVAEMVRVLRPGGQLIITVPFLYPTHEAPYDFWRTTHIGLRAVLERHGLEVGEVAAQGGPFLLVSHYLTAGLVQALGLAARRLGSIGILFDNPLIRAIIAAPQRAVQSRLSYRLSAPARIASLGYMTIGRKP